ncbi:helix-turn-helix domain-containing protein [Agrobacterium cucumeris]|uniref:helix-turn-helix domain-containing protein n=1 Tax=Rhizobium/Agrobacterium group TaxID=227290 RepID=UPI003D1604B4
MRNCSRDSFLRNFSSPVIEAPCTWKTFFARSIPIIVPIVIFAVLPSRWISPTILQQELSGGKSGNHSIYSNLRQRLRLSRALAMLSDGFPVQTVSHKLGYSTNSAFIAMFQAATGATPNAFRGLARDEDETSN